MAEANWFEKIIGSNNPAQQEFYNNIPFNLKQTFTTPKYRQNSAGTLRGRKAELGREDSRMSALNPNASAPKTGPAAFRDPGDTGEKARFGRVESQIAPQTELKAPPKRSGGGGGGGGSGLDKVFAPLFAALDQQRSNANSRYTENSGQIKNIYGQLIGARTGDVDSIDTAYERLQTAAATRGAETMSGMAGRESDRVSGNQAVLGSMGIGDLGAAGNDVASEGAQAAQNTEAANQSNYAGMLDMMNATSQDIARADATSFGYRQGEDIARLQGSREDFMQDLDQQKFGLQNQQAQGEYQYKQQQQQAAAAAAAARRKADADAINDARKMDQQKLSAWLDNTDPFTRGAYLAEDVGVVSAQGVANMRDAYDQFLAGLPAPTLQQPYNKNLIAEDFGKSVYAEGLNKTERDLIKKAIRETF
jgi:hypothetical protein